MHPLPATRDATRDATRHAAPEAATPGALSDTDLDTIAGGGAGQQALNSVLSLGFGCLVASLTALGAQRDCGAEIETLFKGDLPPRDGLFRF